MRTIYLLVLEDRYYLSSVIGGGSSFEFRDASNLRCEIVSRAGSVLFLSRCLGLGGYWKGGGISTYGVLLYCFELCNLYR